MKMDMNKDLDMPEGLCPKGIEAYNAILTVLKENEATYTGGCKAFYSPEEWEERGEEYGQGSILIVVYEGSAIQPFFSMDYDYPKYTRTGKISQALEKLGMHYNECTNWYAAIYT